MARRIDVDHTPSRDRRADTDAVGTFGGTLRTVRGRGPRRPVIKAWSSEPASTRRVVDDVVFAQSYANSETPCIGRWAALHAGLPISVPGLQIDRRCGGGLQAVITAAMMVATGAADVVLAGGVESMSNIEHYTTSVALGRPVRGTSSSTTASTAAGSGRSRKGASARSPG